MSNSKTCKIGNYLKHDVNEIKKIFKFIFKHLLLANPKKWCLLFDKILHRRILEFFQLYDLIYLFIFFSSNSLKNICCRVIIFYRIFFLYKTYG